MELTIDQIIKRAKDQVAHGDIGQAVFVLANLVEALADATNNRNTLYNFTTGLTRKGKP